MLEIVSGTIKKGDRKGQKWYALRISVGEYSRLIFPGSTQPLTITNFEFNYIKKELGFEEE